MPYVVTKLHPANGLSPKQIEATCVALLNASWECVTITPRRLVLVKTML